jgi:hypothetical protein
MMTEGVWGWLRGQILKVFSKRRAGNGWLWRAAALMSLLVMPLTLGAQSCPLCYQSAASGGPHFLQALRNGVIILFFPPLLIFGVIFYAAYRKRNQFNSAESATRIEFAFDEPECGPEGSLDDGARPQHRANIADTIEL